MSDALRIAEVIAKLDIYERDLRKMADRAREIRVELFNAIDTQRLSVIE